MFLLKVWNKIDLSTLFVLVTYSLLLKISLYHIFLSVFLRYDAPYMFTNAWIVLYTLFITITHNYRTMMLMSGNG